MPLTPSLDPLKAAADITASYLRYLRSTFSPSDPTLKAEFEQVLGSNFGLTQGPLLQASAPYKAGATVAELVDAGVLSRGFLSMPADAFPLRRPLYAHQETAIRKLVEGRNLMVATGTGSGKTECFLFPIIDHLLREADTGTLAQPGVRALLLYPMNALANDQMKRLRDLLNAFPNITFGRYIGDTAAKHREALSKYRARFGAEPQANELISR